MQIAYFYFKGLLASLHLKFYMFKSKQISYLSGLLRTCIVLELETQKMKVPELKVIIFSTSAQIYFHLCKHIVGLLLSKGPLCSFPWLLRKIFKATVLYLLVLNKMLS